MKGHSMRLGTKILLLTLAITLVLSGTIIVVVSSAVTKRETTRARGAITSAISNYFERVQRRRHRVDLVVRLLMEDSQNRGSLEQIESDNPTDRQFAQTQLGEEIFGRTVQTELSRDDIPPAFHVLLSAPGIVLVASAPKDQALLAALGRRDIEWAQQQSMKTTGARPSAGQYVWIAQRLYLALPVPLSVEINGPPSHVYYAGYRVDDAWANDVVGASMAGMGDALAAQVDRPPTLRAWFLVNGAVVAQGTSDATDHAVPAAAVPAKTLRSGEWLPVSFDAGGEEFVGESMGFAPAAQRHGTIVVASSLTDALAALRHLQRNIGIVTVVVALLAVVAFRFVSNLIAKPVRALVAGTQRLARGEFDEPVVLNRRDELGELAESFNAMAAGLQERDFVKDTFGKFVDPQVVQGFLADRTQLKLGGERRVQTVLFSDLVNFTSLSERLGPEELVGLLNSFLSDAAEAVTELGGIVDKFIGDAVVALWGPPLSDDHAARACRAALKFVEAARARASQCEAMGVPPLAVRVGIATGEVLVGIIGSTNKYNYTVMGDTANLGSRLEGLNKFYGTRILVNARAAAEAGSAVATRRIDRVRVLGRDEALDLYEVVSETANEAEKEVTDRYAEGLRMYEAKEWAAACDSFERLSRDFPADGPTAVLLERSRRIMRDSSSSFDGVWSFDAK